MRVQRLEKQPVRVQESFHFRTLGALTHADTLRVRTWPCNDRKQYGRPSKKKQNPKPQQQQLQLQPNIHP